MAGRFDFAVGVHKENNRFLPRKIFRQPATGTNHHDPPASGCRQK
jgi:hypothetical protein